MAIQFPDPNVTATSNIKDVNVKVVKLTFADFTTTGIAAVDAILPADATIIELSYWKKTQFSGNSVSAVTLSIGDSSSATKYVNAFDVLTPNAGNSGHINPSTNIMQAYQVPLGLDFPLLFTGTATTGNPTAGEIYIKIVFVR